ncbi:hypothetical protein [Lysobacter capsici]|uniref:hypothetical protein n=1 Tax=Lysobacter capsici TaxID=435897 RepID=UPI0012FE5047|nr:hypothetical protein [Lysobacter capsici]
MYDVLLVRSPPKGRGWEKPGRPVKDIEDEPPRERVMRHGHWLSRKNLNPLRRYLASQVGQPWNAVYAQLCAQRNPRDPTHDRIFHYLPSLIALEVWNIAGVLHARHSWRGLLRLEDIGQTLYVDPDSGRVAINESAIRLRARLRREHSQRVKANRLGLEPDLRRLGERRQLRRIDGIWYEIELMPVPPQAEPRKPEQRRRNVTRVFPFDAITHKKVTQCDGERCRRYGSCKLYAARKRQLSGAELLEHGLANGFEPDSYLKPTNARKPGQQPFKFRVPVRNGARHKEH